MEEEEEGARWDEGGKRQTSIKLTPRYLSQCSTDAGQEVQAEAATAARLKDNISQSVILFMILLLKIKGRFLKEVSD